MKQKNIEVEIRSLITQKQYNSLLRFFNKEGKFLGKENQTSYYFSGKHDLRIQKSDSYAKIWMKKGKMHANAREEIEVKFSKNEFENAKNIFLALGYYIEIKWFRKRNTFIWKGISVMLDYTKGYGHVIELEKMCKESEREKIQKILRDKLNFLKIKETNKKDFDEKFKYYKNNWQKLV